MNPYRSARIAAHMTQEHLAGAAGISEKTIRNLEAGKAVSAETIRAVRSVLGMTGVDPHAKAYSDDTIASVGLWMSRLQMVLIIASIGMMTHAFATSSSIMSLTAFNSLIIFLLAALFRVQVQLRQPDGSDDFLGLSVLFIGGSTATTLPAAMLPTRILPADLIVSTGITAGAFLAFFPLTYVLWKKRQPVSSEATITAYLSVILRTLRSRASVAFRAAAQADWSRYMTNTLRYFAGH